MDVLQAVQPLDFKVQASFVVLAIVGSLYALYLRLLPKPFPGIPYNHESAKRLLGDAPDMAKEISITRELNVWLVNQVNKFQVPVCQVFIEPFSKPWILIADSVEAKDIMTRRPEWDRSEYIIDRLSPLDSFHARFKMGKEWKQSRAWLQDLISPTFLNNTVAPNLYDTALTLVEYWKRKAAISGGRAFDVDEDLNHTALDGMLSFFFAEHFDHRAIGPHIEAVSKMEASEVPIGYKGDAQFPKAPIHDFLSALYETVEAMDEVSKAVSPKFTMWWIRQTRKFKRIVAIKKQVVEEQAQGALERLQATGKPKTAIEYMMMREQMSAEKEGRKPKFDNQVIMEEIASQFIGGLHTTSTALSWFFTYMTRFPDMQARLRDDIHATYPEAYAEGRLPTASEIAKSRTPYLEAVIEEQFRLHATSLSRQASRDTELLGHFVPKGTNVILIANGPGFHQPSYDVDPGVRSDTARKQRGWDESRDMAAFEPERWLVTNDRGEVEFDANAAPGIAFGMGPRSCWGKRLAMLELRIALTLVVWHFDLLPIPKILADTKASYGIVHRADQCYIRPKSRNLGPQKSQ